MTSTVTDAPEGTASRVWISIYSERSTRAEMERALQIKNLATIPRRNPARDEKPVFQKPNSLSIQSDLALSDNRPMSDHLAWAADYIAESADRISSFLKQQGNHGSVFVFCVSVDNRVDYILSSEVLETFYQAGLSLEVTFEYDGPSSE